MKFEIRWSLEARADLRAVHAWLSEQSPERATRFAYDIRAAIRLLSQFPHLGPVARDLEPAGRYRQLVRGWHRVIYRVDGSSIRILRIWDSRRNPDDLTMDD